MNTTSPTRATPEILAPAGGKQAFLAALAAGADAVYCGLKRFSARMAAENFTPMELGRLARLARARDVKVYVAFNSMMKCDEIAPAEALLAETVEHVQPDGLIVQDLGVAALARRAGFNGELHLSTLANVSFPAGLAPASRIPGVRRVVLPRELTIDEIRRMADACPPDLGLEVFVHGALCYGVSGRCYWSSFLGGKSGLRGRCVQPCRRLYEHNGDKRRFFSCKDLSLDVLTRVLRPVEQIRAWKIEGRKKGPHYVYYTVSAYRILRDEGHDARARKTALALLNAALGRPGSHYRFLPQRLWNPIDTDAHTGSGRMIAEVKGPSAALFISPGEKLLSGDLLRVGYEDEESHQIIRVSRSVPRNGKLVLKPGGKKTPRRGAAVFLIDRREPEMLARIDELEKALALVPEVNIETPGRRTPSSRPARKRPFPKAMDLTVRDRPERNRTGESEGIWLDGVTALSMPARRLAATWWWLPPAIWPADEDDVARQVRRIKDQGGRRFVLNAPWQTALLKGRTKVELWAGPFCNAANPGAVEMLRDMGFRGVFVSPELSRRDCLALAAESVLALGIVIRGFWPVSLSRVLAENVVAGKPFISPKGEAFRVARKHSDYWIFPNWEIDLSRSRPELEKAGFTVFAAFEERPPKTAPLKHRPGRWNWDLDLK